MAKRITIERPNPYGFAHLPVAIIIGPQGAEQARTVSALLDTGADNTVIRASILTGVGIPTTGRTLNFTGAGATGMVGTAMVRLGFSGINESGELATLVNSKEIAVAATLTEEMIVGLDVLGCFDVSFFRSGRVTLEWG